jgi:hypothetical protein
LFLPPQSSDHLQLFNLSVFGLTKQPTALVNIIESSGNSEIELLIDENGLVCKRIGGLACEPGTSAFTRGANS